MESIYESKLHFRVAREGVDSPEIDVKGPRTRLELATDCTGFA